MMYINIGLNSRETVPLNARKIVLFKMLLKGLSHQRISITQYHLKIGNTCICCDKYYGHVPITC